jgi:hypothetical protein
MILNIIKINQSKTILISVIQTECALNDSIQNAANSKSRWRNLFYTYLN